MNKVAAFLNANPVQYLATVGRDGKAKCRPERLLAMMGALQAPADGQHAAGFDQPFGQQGNVVVYVGEVFFLVGKEVEVERGQPGAPELPRQQFVFLVERHGGMGEDDDSRRIRQQGQFAVQRAVFARHGYGNADAIRGEVDHRAYLRASRTGMRSDPKGLPNFP